MSNVTNHALVTSWSVLHLSDVLVHFRQARVPYGYILVGCLYKALRVISDVFVLWGTVRVLIRYSHLRPNIRKPQSIFCVATVVAVLLLFVGLYQICLMFALSFAWLSFSDLNVIDAIAKARSGSEIAFTALEFVSTIVITFWAKIEFRAALEDGTNYYVVRFYSLEIYVRDRKQQINAKFCHRKALGRAQHLSLS